MDAVEEVAVEEVTLKDLNDRLFNNKDDDVTNCYTAYFNKHEFALFANEIQIAFGVEITGDYLKALICILEAKRLLERDKTDITSYFIMRDIFTRIVLSTDIENIFTGTEKEGNEDESTESC